MCQEVKQALKGVVALPAILLCVSLELIINTYRKARGKPEKVTRPGAQATKLVLWIYIDKRFRQ